MSINNINVKHKLSLAGKNRVFSKSTLKKLSKAHKGHTRTRKKSEIDAIISGEALSWAKYRLLRKEILIRDNNKCQICGNIGNVTHHIKNRKNFPELFFIKSNIITICTSCHIKEDKIIESRWKN